MGRERCLNLLIAKKGGPVLTTAWERSVMNNVVVPEADVSSGDFL